MRQVSHSAARAETSRTDREEGLSRGPLSGVRVLVVDDDRMPRKIVANAVIKAGGEPVEAEDGADGLSLFSSAPEAIDAAVVDFQMPGLDGTDVVQTMRSLGFRGPVIGLTGTASEAQINAWILAGCDEVLEKGISMTELVSELAAAYRRRRNKFRFHR